MLTKNTRNPFRRRSCHPQFTTREQMYNTGSLFSWQTASTWLGVFIAVFTHRVSYGRSLWRALYGLMSSPNWTETNIVVVMNQAYFVNTQWSRKNAQGSMHHHSTTVCSRIARFSPKCSRKKDHCLPANAKFISPC